MNGLPWWFPEQTDDVWLKRIREDYPEDAHLDDETLRDEYADGAKYAALGLWDHKGDAYDDYEKLADAFLDALEALEEIAENAVGGRRWTEQQVRARARAAIVKARGET